MLYGIPWGVVQRMMIDAPTYDTDGDKDVQEITLTQDNSQQILNFVNSMM